ncbi:MAG: isoaspartyl peptidase/L-asparaginase family protein [Candidatus Thermoplasmatota archaeon]|nr:isoaspartyl peptidase/L-asparaginase family protein [Candidatus Thermoplasmatota archaeon]
MKYIILAHGGSGSDPETHEEAVREAVMAGRKVLEQGASALDIAEAVVKVQEDNPIFNAGTGSYLTLDGRYEMDASVMDDMGRMGAVANVSSVRHPISLARKVMDTPHVLLAGRGAEEFARRQGFPQYTPRSEKAEKRLLEVRESIRQGKYPDWTAGRWEPYTNEARKLLDDMGCDTVGCVVLDPSGRMAVACSTGGTSYKLSGRVGDSPLVGAGLYAGPAGAVTATGIGEEIIKRVASWEVYRRMEEGMNPQEACDQVVDKAKNDPGHEMGIIALSKNGWGAACTRKMAYYVDEML